MKFQVLQERLSQTLNVAGRFVSSRAQLPVLSNIYLAAKQNKIVVSATNLEMSFSTSIGAKVESPGEITVPARVIVDLISAAPSGPLDIEADKEQLTLESGSFASRVNSMNAGDFPTVAQKLSESSFDIESGMFKQLLSKVLFAVSSDETRPVLNGVLFAFDKKIQELVATDGFRLSRLTLSIKTNLTGKFVVPKNILAEVVKIAGESEKIGISFDPKDNLVVFVIGSTILSSRIIEGAFPDYDKIIPKSLDYNIDVDKSELSQSLKAVSVFARDSSNLVKLNLTEKSLTLTSESNQSGSGQVNVDVKVRHDKTKFKDMLIAFNYKYISDFINSISSESMEIGLIGPDSPGVFIDPQDKDFLHLIMPVKIEE